MPARYECYSASHPAVRGCGLTASARSHAAGHPEDQAAYSLTGPRFADQGHDASPVYLYTFQMLFPNTRKVVLQPPRRGRDLVRRQEGSSEQRAEREPSNNVVGIEA